MKSEMEVTPLQSKTVWVTRNMYSIARSKDNQCLRSFGPLDTHVKVASQGAGLLALRRTDSLACASGPMIHTHSLPYFGLKDEPRMLEKA